MGIVIDTVHPTTTAAIGVWGENGQKAILQEECSELISALARYNRGRTGKEPVAEEVADVIVSMMSVIPVLDIEDEVKEQIKYKLNRLTERVYNESEKGI